MTDEELLQMIEEAKESGATTLDLSLQKLTFLPPEIYQLKNLKRLYLQGNSLTSLPPEISQLTNLQELVINDNRLRVLPPELGQMTNLKFLYLPGNRLSSPPQEIIRKGTKAIKQYFTALQNESQPLSEVKLLLVGDGEAGKTSLINRLINNTFNPNEDTTHGINIRGCKVKNSNQPIRINIWDFGGQEIMHATHQFFLSKRSLYVLVLDGRRDERPEYWLRHLESFGGDSPVLVVLNKYDSNPSFDVNRPFLMQKYPTIKGFFRTSCADGRGISHFRDSLLRELAHVEMINIRWPGSWFRVKEQIKRLNKPCISRDEYTRIYTEEGITAEEGLETLVGFLHDLGIALHFKDFVLDNIYVLDPLWVTTAVYKIINAEQVAAAKGTLQLSSLEELLMPEQKEQYLYPKDTHIYIIELMKKFQLCYSINQGAILIPQLLGVVEPVFSFDHDSSLSFALHFHDLLPLSILPRFIVKLHKDIKDNLCWRTGVVLQDHESGSEAVVKADYEARRINLWVNGPRRKEYLHFLWYSFQEIKDNFKKLPVSERVPMPDDPQSTADYETLLKYATREDDTYYPEGSNREYKARELLGLVQPNGENELFELIKKINNQLDNKESSAEMLNNFIEPKITFFGITFNLKWLFEKILAREKR